MRQAPNGECVYLQSSTQHFTDSHELFIELDLTLEPTTYEYCAEAILNGREKTIVDGRELVEIVPLYLVCFVDRYMWRQV